MRDLLHGALGALMITAACGGSDPPGGGNGDTDGGKTSGGDGKTPDGDGPTGSCQWDEEAGSYPFPDNPNDPMMDPDCNPLIPCINEDDDDHRWRDVSRDDGMPLRTGFDVQADVAQPTCAYYYSGEGSEIRHAPGDACVTISNETTPSLVLAGDRLSLDVTYSVLDGPPRNVVMTGQVLDNGTRMRYTILEWNGPINWTFEIERLPLPPGVTTSEHCLPPP